LIDNERWGDKQRPSLESRGPAHKYKNRPGRRP